MFRTSKCSSSGRYVHAVWWYFFHGENVIKEQNMSPQIKTCHHKSKHVTINQNMSPHIKTCHHTSKHVTTNQNMSPQIKTCHHKSKHVTTPQNMSLKIKTTLHFYWYLMKLIFYTCGLGSSVGIATDYGLDCPGSNPGRDEIFRSSRPALCPTQPPVKWVPGLPRGRSAAGACCWPLTAF